MTCLCLWLGLQVSRVNARKSAAVAIIDGGGWITYRHEIFAPHKPGTKMRPKYPESQPAKWQVQLFGEHWFNQAMHVELEEGEGTGTLLSSVRKFSELESLNLWGSDVADADLKSLEALSELESLHLNETAISDAGLIQLRGLRELEALSLRDTYVTDAGLENLSNMPKLAYLDLGYTCVSDEGISHLASIASLRTLRLDYTDITDDGVERLKRVLPQCKVIE